MPNELPDSLVVMTWAMIFAAVGLLIYLIRKIRENSE